MRKYVCRMQWNRERHKIQNYIVPIRTKWVKISMRHRYRCLILWVIFSKKLSDFVFILFLACLLRTIKLFSILSFWKLMFRRPEFVYYSFFFLLFLCLIQYYSSNIQSDSWIGVWTIHFEDILFGFFFRPKNWRAHYSRRLSHPVVSKLNYVGFCFYP